MSLEGVRSIAELLAEDPAYPAWLASQRITHPAWYTCAHEAGHVVGALVLLQAPVVRAVIFNSREGATWLPRAVGFKQAVVIAAGEAGARVVRRLRPPEGHPAYYSCEAAYDAALVQPTDAECLREAPGGPGVMAPSRKMIRKHAAGLVRRYAQWVLAAAGHLFRHGSGEFSLKVRGASDGHTGLATLHQGEPRG